MKRRDVLSVAAVGVTGALAGCITDGGLLGDDQSGGGSAPFEHPGTLEATFATNGDYPSDDDPADGRPPEFPDPPDVPDADESTFGTLSVNGESVKLAPIDVVEAWYRRGEARFVDARGLGQYERSHVYGSVFSRAQEGSTGGGIEGWNTADRVVTYCGCPHHLSSIRAAGLQKAGFERVYAIDEGFGEWFAREYPMAGTDFRSGAESDVSEWLLSGTVDARHAGEYAWASAARQYEAAPIAEDGSFELALRFAAVTEETPVRVSTPEFTVTKPLGELADGALDGASV